MTDVMRDVAVSLIEALGAINCEESIRGTVGVLKALEKSINELWEAYLIEETNEWLKYDNTCCSECKAPIRVLRTKDTIYVEEVYRENE